MSGKPIDDAVKVLRKLRDELQGLVDDYPVPCAARDEEIANVSALDAAIAALTAAQQQQGQAVACGGCGNADPEKVCIGCLHPFAAPQPMQQGGGEVVNGIEISEAIQLGRRYIGEMDKRGRPRAAQVFEALLIVAERRAAPPSAPVGVEGLGLRDALLRARAKLSDGEWDGLCRMFREQDNIIRTQRNRLAQQPAAVDAAALRRALAEYPGRNTHQLQAAKVCAGVIALAATFAAQHQETTTQGKKHDGPCWRNSHADCGC